LYQINYGIISHNFFGAAYSAERASVFQEPALGIPRSGIYENTDSGAPDNRFLGDDIFC